MCVESFVWLHYHVLISLQEVDRFDDLDGLLKNMGFQGVHKVCLSQKLYNLICIDVLYFFFFWYKHVLYLNI